VTGPDGRIFNVANDGSLATIGSTELFTESAEPGIDENDLKASIAQFQAMFPEGEYQFGGTTVGGDTLVGTAELSHDLPAAPGVIVNIADADNAVVEWSDTSGPGDPEIVLYEVIVELDAVTLSMELLPSPDGGPQSLRVPPELFAGVGPLEGKVEVLAIAENGNKTISEVAFVPEPAMLTLMGLGGLLALHRRGRR